VQVYNYSTHALLQTTATPTFFSNAGATCAAISDPRVIYDSAILRWLVVDSCPSDYLLVSSSSDATTATWKSAVLSTRSGDLTMHVGFDTNWITVTEFDSVCGGATYVEIALPGADAAWSGAGTISLTHEVISGCHTPDAVPSVDLTPSKGTTAPAYLISRSGATQNQVNAQIILALDKLTPTTSTAATFSAAGTPVHIITPWLYNTPLNVAQPSSPNIKGTESHHPSMAVILNNHLYVTWPSGPCASSCGSQGVAAHQGFFWFDVTLPGLTLNQSGQVFDSTLGFLMPSISVDSNGTVLITATGAAGSQDASVYGWYHLATDGAGVLHGPNLLTSGTQVYGICNNNNPVGWGTYQTTVTDANDETTVCSGVEYAASATACQWHTRLLCMTVPLNPPPSSAPAPAMLAKE
jgi:hypothetical protein